MIPPVEPRPICPKCQEPVVRTTALRGILRAMAWKCPKCDWEGLTPDYDGPVKKY